MPSSNFVKTGVIDREGAEARIFQASWLVVGVAEGTGSLEVGEDDCLHAASNGAVGSSPLSSSELDGRCTV